MYVEKKAPIQFEAKKDSAVYFYAGNANDIKNVYKTLGVNYTDSSMQDEWGTSYAVNYQPVIRTSPLRKQVMPNVRGMGLKDAIFILESMGVKVAVKGRGKITSQSIPPGVALTRGAAVVLELS
ncbi:MAG TPA: PASTA domain-containing protein [Chitinophagaceae bacterium]|nr:PASTA domain-containing protein [Chitinophagaceae bacterium]